MAKLTRGFGNIRISYGNLIYQKWLSQTCSISRVNLFLKHPVYGRIYVPRQSSDFGEGSFCQYFRLRHFQPPGMFLFISHGLESGGGKKQKTCFTLISSKVLLLFWHLQWSNIEYMSLFIWKFYQGLDWLRVYWQFGESFYNQMNKLCN